MEEQGGWIDPDRSDLPRRKDRLTVSSFSCFGPAFFYTDASWEEFRKCCTVEARGYTFLYPLGGVPHHIRT